MVFQLMKKVAAHFLAIIPLFPTPDIITFPFLQLRIILINFKNFLLIFFLNFLMH